MASSSSLFLSLLLSFSLLPLSIHSANSSGFSIDLIPRDHPTKSPFFNSSLSSSDRLLSAFRRSISRFHHLFQTKDSFNSQIIPNQFEYLMTLQVGTPPFNILAIADTGSDLTWTQCQPCTSCYRQDGPIFNPKNSSSYETLSCKSDSCSELPEGGCTSRSLCEYSYGYGDQSYTNGILSTETFTFNSDDKSGATIPNVTFGCSHESKGSFDKHGSGLAGLGGGPLSLVSQFSSSIDKKFSYCLVPFSNSNNATSLLNFGDKAVVRGNAVTTPIVPGETDTFYYLSLESINIRSEKVTVAAPKLGQQEGEGQGQGNIIIDSGTTLTLLSDTVLDPVKEKVMAAVKYPKVQDPDGVLDLCFDVSNAGDQVEMPELSFVFSGDATVKLQPYNSFVSLKEGVVCLAMASSGNLGGGLSIYGNIAQQNFHIGFDLEAKKLSIAPADCAKL